MVKHIVLWRLAENVDSRSQHENMLIIKDALYGMLGLIPGLMKIEVGMNQIGDEQGSDISLIAEFDGWDSFLAYRNHPKHLPVKELMQNYVVERRVIDYEI
ncbi:MAG: Dabb family protein [Syntrophaceae bacterium]|nr:Dabb family protein [Syntrophaceae bacterium]